ncbi:hypothetical protein ACIA48_22490 [Mycobacterium sp. NPDC051804]|uniref:hypothetical protein n=1 Tax=Mycobacterium sp. NPDC051804 TaxID=3364295 RepID=UPI0037BD0FD6
MNIAHELRTTDSARTRTQKLAGAFVAASAIAAAMLLTTLADHAKPPSNAHVVILADDDDEVPTLKPFPTDELPEPTLKPFPTESTTPPAPQRGGSGGIHVPERAGGGLAVG